MGRNDPHMCYVSEHPRWFFGNQKTDGRCCSGSTHIDNDLEGGTARVCNVHNICYKCGRVYTDNKVVTETSTNGNIRGNIICTSCNNPHMCYVSEHPRWFFSNQKTDGRCCSYSTCIDNNLEGGTARVCNIHNICYKCGKVYTDNKVVTETSTNGNIRGNIICTSCNNPHMCYVSERNNWFFSDQKTDGTCCFEKTHITNDLEGNNAIVCNIHNKCFKCGGCYTDNKVVTGTSTSGNIRGHIICTSCNNPHMCYVSEHQNWFFNDQKTNGTCCSNSTHITNDLEGGTARVCNIHNSCFKCEGCYTDNRVVTETSTNGKRLGNIVCTTCNKGSITERYIKPANDVLEVTNKFLEVALNVFGNT